MSRKGVCVCVCISAKNTDSVGTVSPCGVQCLIGLVRLYAMNACQCISPNETCCLNLCASICECPCLSLSGPNHFKELFQGKNSVLGVTI